MSDEKPKIQEMQVLKDHVDVKLTIPSFMYHRLNQLLLHGIPYKDMEELGKVLEMVKTGNTSEHALAYHTETLILMINYIEVAAKEQDLIAIARIDLETGKEILP